MSIMEQLNGGVTWLKPKGLWVRGMLLWLLYKLVQATIAAAFSIIIVSQASVAGLLRMCFGEPAALLKVQAAQMGTAASTLPAAAQQNGTETQQKAGKTGTVMHLRAVAADPCTAKPMHLSVDPSKGEATPGHVACMMRCTACMCWMEGIRQCMKPQ
jgi:hypothetical protein